MTDAQRDAAFGLVRASLSAKGFELTQKIMRLNETLAELSGDHAFQYPSFGSSVQEIDEPAGRDVETAVVVEVADRGRIREVDEVVCEVPSSLNLNVFLGSPSSTAIEERRYPCSSNPS
jgi:hypothetical protein